MEQNQKKSQGPIENVGKIFESFQKTIHVEFVRCKKQYSADFPFREMIVYDNEASGFLCMNFDGSFRMVKLTLLSSESFRLTVHNGQEIEMSYEKSFVKRRKRWTMGFYVKKMRMVA